MAEVILTDIEGTTSSISFVKDVLFPYAAKHLPEFIRGNSDLPEVRQQLDAVAQQANIAKDDIAAIINELLHWIAEDRKATPLKALQGLVWEHGYTSGAYAAHVYEDAYTQLKAWKQNGKQLYVYSSGSVYAQKLFFAHSDFGDMLPLFSGHFDTTIGGKREVESYLKIAQHIAVAPNNILFLSDIVEELDAAQAAGMQTCWIVRPQDTQATTDELVHTRHRTAESFLYVT